MENETSGTFEVNLTLISKGDGDISSMLITKIFHGGLRGSSVGQMLAYRATVEGSAGYVAIERVTASLGGREGAFTLQHHGLLNRGAPSQTVVVIPDSATGALAGLTGIMTITVTPGRHDYRFQYTLPG
ncbi:MAG: DUF3224 domain-containing protein [Acidocella sp.]|nr:DUF3224 domain-containing protein [Acidocella sp.]